MDEATVSQLFKSVDTGTVVELLSILISATLLVYAVQRILPWLGGFLQGQARLTLIATVPFIRLAIIVSTFIIVVPRIIEPSVQNMVALLGTVGLALGFALKDYASSLIAGVVALGETNYRNGDWVKVGGIYGEVRHVGMRTIELITPDDDRVLIPHSLLWNEPVSNSNNGEPRLQCTADFYLQPDHDCDLVRQSLEDVALTSAYLYFGSPVVVSIREKPWGTHYRLKAYPIDSAQQFRFVTDLTTRGKAALQVQGVQYATSPFAAT